MNQSLACSALPMDGVPGRLGAQLSRQGPSLNETRISLRPWLAHPDARVRQFVIERMSVRN